MDWFCAGWITVLAGSIFGAWGYAVFWSAYHRKEKRRCENS
jgi:hypothetical protein